MSTSLNPASALARYVEAEKRGFISKGRKHRHVRAPGYSSVRGCRRRWRSSPPDSRCPGIRRYGPASSHSTRARPCHGMRLRAWHPETPRNAIDPANRPSGRDNTPTVNSPPLTSTYSSRSAHRSSADKLCRKKHCLIDGNSIKNGSTSAGARTWFDDARETNLFQVPWFIKRDSAGNGDPQLLKARKG